MAKGRKIAQVLMTAGVALALIAPNMTRDAEGDEATAGSAALGRSFLAQPADVEADGAGDAAEEAEVLGTQEAGPDEPMGAVGDEAPGEAALDRGDPEGGEDEEHAPLHAEDHLGVAEGESPYVEEGAAAYEAELDPEALNNYEPGTSKWPLLLTLVVSVAAGVVFAMTNKETGPRKMPAAHGHDDHGDHGGGEEDAGGGHGDAEHH